MSLHKLISLTLGVPCFKKVRSYSEDLRLTGQPGGWSSTAGPESSRRRVTLMWNRDDVLAVIGSLLEEGTPGRFIEFPIAECSSLVQQDEVFVAGLPVGLSTYCGNSASERKFLSLAMVDVAQAEPGTDVVVLRGEPDGGSRKARGKRHRQMEIRATVAPVPFAYCPQSTGSASH